MWQICRCDLRSAGRDGNSFRIGIYIIKRKETFICGKKLRIFCAKKCRSAIGRDSANGKYFPIRAAEMPRGIF